MALKLSTNRIFNFVAQANLVAHDVWQLHQDAAAKCIHILKDFKNQHELSAALREAGISRPVLPAETRWNSVADSFQYLSDNWAGLLRIARSKLNATEPTLVYLKHPMIQASLQEMLDVYKPISIALDRLQSENTTIADAVEIWLDMCATLREIPNESVHAILVDRSSECVGNSAFLAANLLHPRYRAKRLTGAQLKRAKAFIVEQNAECRRALDDYILCVSPYDEGADDTASMHSVDAAKWWLVGEKMGFDSSLVRVANVLVGACASSASLERFFSTLGFTYGTLRNRLPVWKAGRMTFLYRVFRSHRQ